MRALMLQHLDGCGEAHNTELLGMLLGCIKLPSPKGVQSCESLDAARPNSPQSSCPEVLQGDRGAEELMHLL